MSGIGQFLGGLGIILGKAGTYIPGRVEKIKNEIDKLEQEEAKIELLILDVSKPEDRKRANRLFDIRQRLLYLTRLLRSKVND
jgi:Mg2+ and Co2+ transporter CorA